MAVSRRRISAVGRIQANCQPTDAIGDAVYITGDKVGSLYQVAIVDISDRNKMPAVGIIIDKLTTTECIVQTSGIWENSYTGLTPNVPLFIDATGKLTSVRPARPLSGIRFVQTMAQALSQTDVEIRLDMPTVLVSN